MFQGAYYLVLVFDWIGMWTFMLISLGVALALPAIAQAIKPELYVNEEVLRKQREATQPELIGIDRDFTREDIASIDDALKLPAEDRASSGGVTSGGTS